MFFNNLYLDIIGFGYYCSVLVFLEIEPYTRGCDYGAREMIGKGIIVLIVTIETKVTLLYLYFELLIAYLTIQFTSIYLFFNDLMI